MSNRQHRVKDIVWIATDSEWEGRTWLSTAFSTEDGDVVFVTSDIPEAIKLRLQDQADQMQVRVVFTELHDFFDKALECLRLSDSSWRLLIYFTPRDVEYALGWEGFKAAILDGKVRQKNNISGVVKAGTERVSIKDLRGWYTHGLKKFAATLGVPGEDKGLMDHYKTHMRDGLMEQPELYLRYAVNDSRTNVQIHKAFVGYFRDMQRELGMVEEDLWNENDIPMTMGKLVAATFERWVHRLATNPDLFKYAIRKIGVLDPDSKDYKKSLSAMLACRRFRHAGAVAEAMETADPFVTQVMKAKYMFTGLEGCSVRWWASRPTTETTGYNALTHGGRCHNENPFVYRMGPGADVDISQCYGSALEQAVYPVGLPTVWGKTPNEQSITLGQWLETNGDDLLPDLWTATVSGKLSFAQDLIPSKIVKQCDLRRPMEDDGDIQSDLVMLRKEIVNGLMTSSLIDAIKAISNPREWKEFLTLELVTAVAYRKREMVPDLDAWTAGVIEDSGAFTIHGDTRSRLWTPVPLRDFIGRILEARKKCKQQKLSGLDAMLKLTINTMYGSVASRYFPISNTVVSNVVTAKARLWVWQIAKALGCHQTITDGGAYAFATVRSFSEDRKPSLPVFAAPWDWYAPNRRRGYAPFVPPTDLKELDRLVLEHIARFWRPYGLAIPFTVEHKSFIESGAYISKGDYLIVPPDGQRRYAVRGKEKDKIKERHPTFELLDNIVDRTDEFPADMAHTHTSILKIGQYKIVQESSGYQELKDLRPGDDYREQRVARYNNTHFPLDTLDDYLKRKGRKKVNRGKPVEWFEKYRHHGISQVHSHMCANKLA